VCPLACLSAFVVAGRSVRARLGAEVGVGAAPAAASIAGPTDLTTAGRACANRGTGSNVSPVRLNDADAGVLQGSYSGTPESAEPVADFQVWDVTEPDEPQQWRDGVDQRVDPGLATVPADVVAERRIESSVWHYGPFR
jgi:hypothetical protein